MAKNYKYSDFDFDMGKNEFIGDVDVKYDRNSIKQSVMNIILTRKGEKPFNQNFGVGIHDLLFENIGSFEIAMLEKTIAAQFQKYEPRAGLEKVVWYTDKLDSNQLEFEIHFVVVNGPGEPPKKESLRLSLGKVR